MTEGVENAGPLLALQEVGRPMSAAAVAEWMRTSHWGQGARPLGPTHLLPARADGALERSPGWSAALAA